jgi:hypothetical protein
MQALRAHALPSKGCAASRRPAVAVRAVAQAEEVKTVMLKAQRITAEAFAPYGQVRAIARCSVAARARRSGRESLSSVLLA